MTLIKAMFTIFFFICSTLLQLRFDNKEKEMGFNYTIWIFT